MLWLLALACSPPTAPAPQISDDVIRIGTVLPLEGDPKLAAVGTAARDMLVARFTTGESIHGRRIELIARHAPTGGLVAAARSLIAETDVLALVAPQMSGEEEAFARWAADAHIPVVGPFAVHPYDPPETIREVFYTYSGSEQQIRTLVHIAAGAGPLAFLTGTDKPPHDTYLAAVRDQARHSSADLRVLPYADNDCLLLQETGTKAVILGGDGKEAHTWLQAASVAECWTDVFFLAEILGPVFGDLVTGSAHKTRAPKITGFPWGGRLFASTSTRPADWDQESFTLYQETLLKADQESQHMPIQFGALASALLLEAGLQDAGNPPTRQGLIGALEALKEFETGLTPPLSYGPGRRVGALGAWITERDSQLGVSLGSGHERWVTPR